MALPDLAPVLGARDLRPSQCRHKSKHVNARRQGRIDAPSMLEHYSGQGFQVLLVEGLQHKVLQAGDCLPTGLRALAEQHPVIGDMRGHGLFLGVKPVCDRDMLEPATREANRIVNRCATTACCCPPTGRWTM